MTTRRGNHDPIHYIDPALALLSSCIHAQPRLSVPNLGWDQIASIAGISC